MPRRRFCVGLLVLCFFVDAPLPTSLLNQITVIDAAHADDGGDGGNGGNGGDSGSDGGGNGANWGRGERRSFRSDLRRLRRLIPDIWSQPATTKQRAKAPPPKTGKPSPVRRRPAPVPTAAKIGDFEPREILAIDATPTVLSRARSLGFTVRQTVSLDQLSLRITRLRPPANQSPPQALRLLQRRIPRGNFALNHIYRIAAEPCPEDRCYGSTLIGWGRASGGCWGKVKLGMVDTAVNGKTPALASRRIEIRSFAENGKASASTHGTAVAALLVGSAASEFPGLLPEAELYAADTFIGTGANLRTNTLLLSEGLDWLLEKQVSVVNVSLTGPNNKLLHEVIKRLSARNVTVVAAAGNGGPSAPPAFPAAYPEAIAVTAVDNLLRPYRLANRGEYVTVAAPGVRIWTPGPRGGQYSDGTSFAAPYGTAVTALLRQRQSSLHSAALTEHLRNNARDLGAPGKDPVFGWGLLQSPGQCR